MLVFVDGSRLPLELSISEVAHSDLPITSTISVLFALRNKGKLGSEQRRPGGHGSQDTKGFAYSSDCMIKDYKSH